jgi:hypothetical protein
MKDALERGMALIRGRSFAKLVVAYVRNRSSALLCSLVVALDIEDPGKGLVQKISLTNQ